MKIGVGGSEEPGVLVTEAEQAELMDSPVDDEVVLDLELLVQRVLLNEGGHRVPLPGEGRCSYKVKRATALAVRKARLRAC